MWKGRALVKDFAVLAATVVTLSLFCGCSAPPTGQWRRVVKEQLPLLGHRNWIVVADSAYPAQISPGIETIASGADQVLVVKEVIKAVDEAEHVRAKIYLDAELKYVPQSDAPGIDNYRRQLNSILADKKTVYVAHEELIAKLDEAAKTFKILLLKTDMTLPYTSVFLELDCGYWNAEVEQRLRQVIHSAQQHR